MDKPLIKIWDTVGLGIIVEFPTGILVANQTGGTACLQLIVEGVYLPLANDCNVTTHKFLSPEIELTDYFKGLKYKGSGAIQGIDLEDAKNINAIIAKYGLQNLIEIDLEKLNQSHEAWINIKIHKDIHTGLLKGFSEYPLKGVLTWSNSD